MTTIQEVFPEAPPVCAGCGSEVDPRFAHWTTDYRQVCSFCAKKPRWKTILRDRAQPKQRAASS